MSADNWAHCPRCTRRGTERLEARETAVQALYGTVPVNEFDNARRELQAEKDKFARRDPTFREDYEIYGAETGVVTVSYSGSCRECGLQLEFCEDHQIEGIE